MSACAVFACINSLCRAINAAMLAGLPQAQAAPWFCLRAVICYQVICWLFAAASFYPATHAVRRMVEDENFAQTWYVFWVLPLVFIALNLFMIPKYADTLYTGRVLQGYIVISIALLFLMLFFNAIFLLMAISINRNVRLQQENQLLSMQQQRYESLKAAIEEARQARHDLRHQLCQLAALAEEGNLEKIKAYLSGAVSRIPSLELHFCENRAADGVVEYVDVLHCLMFGSALVCQDPIYIANQGVALERSGKEVILRQEDGSVLELTPLTVEWNGLELPSEVTGAFNDMSDNQFDWMDVESNGSVQMGVQDNSVFYQGYADYLGVVPEGMVLGVSTNETADGMPGITFVAAMKYDLYNETLTLTMLDGQNPFAEGKTQLQLIRCPDY